MNRKYLSMFLCFLLVCGGIYFLLTKGGETEGENKDPVAEIIELELDGQVITDLTPPLYVSQQGQVMVPVSRLEELFQCAVQVYKNEEYIIRKNTDRLELSESRQEVERLGQDVYVAASLISGTLGYDMQWDQTKNQLKLADRYPGRSMLPESYDYRQEDRAPQVKNQGTLGTCWSFASLMALESTLLPFEDFEFSEDHMTRKNSFGLSQNDGGEYTMSLAYLLSWQGPVLEEDDPYGDGYSPDGLKPVKHLQEVNVLKEKDYDGIKEAVFRYGGVQSSLYTSMQDYNSRSSYYNRNLFSYCYLGEEKPNHDVVIVGWDDKYPKENFDAQVPGDGAFLCINSWGEEFGENGYFYVSYYDVNIGVYNIVYTKVEEADNYDHIYQTDLCGWIGQLGYGREDVYFANVYEAGEQESLAAAGFYATGKNSTYEIYVSRQVVDGESLNDRVPVASGSLDEAGYYTIPFEIPIELEDKERFAVIVRMVTPGAVHPAAIEYRSDENKANVDTTDGEGYISLHGDSWENVEQTQNCNICLKAYTFSREVRPVPEG